MCSIVSGRSGAHTGSQWDFAGETDEPVDGRETKRSSLSIPEPAGKGKSRRKADNKPLLTSPEPQTPGGDSTFVEGALIIKFQSNDLKFEPDIFVWRMQLYEIQIGTPCCVCDVKSAQEERATYCIKFASSIFCLFEILLQ